MIPSKPYVTRLSLEFQEAISETQELRTSAKRLRSRVSKGEYDLVELREFWKIASGASLILRIANPELAERSGLGSTYFSSVAKDRRRPKLTNMLKALTAIIDVADERLVDVEQRTQNLEGIDWVENAFLGDRELIDRIENDLLSLIQYLKTSNSLSEIPEIDDHYKNNLINILETTLSLLKSPLIERTLIQNAAEALQRISINIADHSSAGFFGGIAGATATELLRLL